MMKGFFIAVALFLLGSGAWAQIERGDSEINFFGNYTPRVGKYVEVNGSVDSFVDTLGGGEYTPTAETVSTPSTPTGPSSGNVGQSLTYTAGGSTSSLEHTVEYRFNWGDGPYSSWGSATRSHEYTAAGTYTVKAQARCQTHR